MKITIKIDSTQILPRIPTAPGKRIEVAKKVKARRDRVNRKAKHKGARDAGL